MSFSVPYLTNNYLNDRNNSAFRGHTSIVHPLYKKELNNGISCIKNFLSQTVLSKAKYNRYQYLYNLSAEKCFLNSSNNYSLSESLECEKLIFNKDPILNNINNFLNHFETKMISEYENQLKNITTCEKYYNNHKQFLLKLNFLYRYYYYYYAKDMFINYNNKN